MRLIIDVPDDLVAEAYEVAMSESHDYGRRYDRPGWGWHQYRPPRRYWVRGIKGGLSVSLIRPATAVPGVRTTSPQGNLPPDEPNPSDKP
jgi:hypothetical protein